MADYKNKKLIYHLTALENIPQILKKGLLPRSQLAIFHDVADGEIIQKRQGLALDEYVPFHWFVGNPFDGIVQKTRKTTPFALITVQRILAAAKNWKVISRHPLANGEIELLDYAKGFEAIDWNLMNQRDYHDPNCKSVCMAECLALGPVTVSQFFAIYVNNVALEKTIRTWANRQGVTVGIDVNENMFLK